MAAPKPEFLAKLEACADQARDLLNAAHAVFDLGTPHVAYPLAIAAVEEIGKRNLLGIGEMSRELDRDAAATFGKKIDDHEQKLFWALFGGGMFRHDITKERFQELQRMAKSFHAKRLVSMYVDDTPDGLSIPAQSIDAAEVKDILGLADALVGMAEAEKPRDDIPEEELENQRWFMNTSEDPELRRFVFSKESMDKLAELDDVGAWVKWMRSKIDEFKAAGAAIVKAEIERGKNAPTKGTRPKWKVRFRIQSASHSIRPKALTEWNRAFDIVKLTVVTHHEAERLEEVPEGLHLHRYVHVTCGEVREPADIRIHGARMHRLERRRQRDERQLHALHVLGLERPVLAPVNLPLGPVYLHLHVLVVQVLDLLEPGRLIRGEVPPEEAESGDVEGNHGLDDVEMLLIVERRTHVF